MATPPEKRGFLKPENRLQWQGTPKPASGKGASGQSGAPAGSRPGPSAGGATGGRPLEVPRPKGLPSNAVPQAQYSLDQIKKMAASRGISVEKMLAQLVQQYLKEE
jgi:hypothetical protein